MSETMRSERTLISKEVFGKVIVELAEKNENIVVCDTDLMRCFGTKAFSGKFPRRHINFGIAEQNCMAASAGIALTGKNVFASSFANFATKRACDQVSISVAYNEANVKVCGLYAGLTAEKNGGTHIGVEDVALMRSIRGCVWWNRQTPGSWKRSQDFWQSMRGRYISGSLKCILAMYITRCQSSGWGKALP